MIRRTPARRLAAVCAAAALVLTACGDDGDDDNKSSGDNDSPSSSAPAKSGDGQLVIGSLLPTTGDLAFLGPPEISGVQKAIDEINENGGVLGKDVETFLEDSGDGTPDIAGQSVDSLLDKKSDAIIGAAASGVSLSVIDKITGAGVVHFSPANTAAAFDTYDDKGLYFRTSPSDRLQGQVLGDLAVQDGYSNVAILARQDAYGEGLAEQVDQTLTEKGATVASHVLYAADAQNFTAEVNEVAASKPDALVLVAFNETTKIIPQLIAKGIGPQDIQIYFVDGNMADYSAESFDLTGVKGTFPAPPEIDPAFNDSLVETGKELGLDVKDFTYGAQAYDAMMLIALAATAADDDSGEAIASQLLNVSRDGTACTTYADCLQLLEDGEDIDYNGVSGPCDFNDTGSPNAATIGIQEYKKGNTYSQIDSVSGVLE